MVRRWLKFNAVGLAGVGVQLGALALFARVWGWHYLVATAAAVEVALLHNFAWHEAWTWRERRGEAGTRLGRLVRFHLGNGLVSVVANVVLMRVLAGALGIGLMKANVMAIGAAALLNFAVSEWWVYGKKSVA